MRSDPLEPSGVAGNIAAAMAIAAVWLGSTAFAVGGGGMDPAQSATNPAPDNAFPDPAIVLDGRVFEKTFDRDVYFLKRVRDAYPAQWAPLLGANLIVGDYVLDPGKLQKFIEELAEAVAGTDDLVASTNLGLIVSEPGFYANTNATRPEIWRAAAKALLGIGPKGRRTLSDAFTEPHYRLGPDSLEVLSEAAGAYGKSDTNLIAALSRAAFSFTAPNGGTYSRCTRKATSGLLQLPGGPAHVRLHLNEKEVLDDPVRFQDVVDAITAAHAVELAADLARTEGLVKSRLELLASSPGPYREELSNLHERLNQSMHALMPAGSSAIQTPK